MYKYRLLWAWMRSAWMVVASLCLLIAEKVVRKLQNVYAL